MVDLTQLQTEMRACQLCLQAGHSIVPGAVFRGEATAQVLLIGQAPGVTEVEAKRPFNASSGRRLFQWLGEAGWQEDVFRATQYMTAVTKCYPGKHSNGKGDRVPSRAEQALCRPFLEQEIAFVNPRVMILVGGLAIKLIFPNKLRLNQLIGTALYFSPKNLEESPVNFDFKQAEWLKTWAELENQIAGEGKEANGRWVVPLPHPSGASLWPNKPENKALIRQATAVLDLLRTQALGET